MPASKPPWGELSRLCRKLRKIIYERSELEKAKLYLPKLERLLGEKKIADDDMTILGAEARAIYHELREEYELALRHRQHEISLMDRLYEEVRRSKMASDTADYALQDRGMEEYKARQKIVHALTERLAER